MTTEKERFAAELLEHAKKLHQVRQLTAELVGTYFDLGFDGGGSDPIADGDITNYNFDAADVANYITLLQQFGNFMDNSAVSTGDYGASLNKVRLGSQ